MKSKNDIITEIYNDNQYLDYCKRVCKSGDLYNDLFQYTVLYLLEMNESKLIQLHDSGGLRMYIARIIYINANSERSDFNKKYNERINIEYIDILEDSNSEETIIKISKEIESEIVECTKNNKYPASAKLLEIYAECGSYQEVANRTKLKYKTVRRLISDLRDKIKNNIK